MEFGGDLVNCLGYEKKSSKFLCRNPCDILAPKDLNLPRRHSDDTTGLNFQKMNFAQPKKNSLDTKKERLSETFLMGTEFLKTEIFSIISHHISLYFCFEITFPPLRADYYLQVGVRRLVAWCSPPI